MSEKRRPHTHTDTHCQPELRRLGLTVIRSPGFSIQPPGSRLSSEWHTGCPGGFSLLHKPPTNEAPSASPLTASVPELRFSTRVWWTCRDARWAWEIHTHADWHNSCEWAKWRISRKTVWWLLLSNHGRKVSVWVRPLGPQLCAANRPADDALNSAQTNVFSSALQLH